MASFMTPIALVGEQIVCRLDLGQPERMRDQVTEWDRLAATMFIRGRMRSLPRGRERGRDKATL